MGWRRAFRYVAAIVGLGFAAFLYIKLSARHPVQPAARAPLTLPPDVVSAGDQGKTVRTQMGRPDRTLSYGKFFQTADGHVHMDVVKFDFTRGARAFALTSDALDAKNDPGAAPTDMPKLMTFTGHAHLHASDGFELDADRIDYSDPDGVATIPGAMHFARGRMAGSSIGAVYQHDQDLLTMQTNATLEIHADAAGQGVLSGRAGTMVIARADHYLRLDGQATMVRDQETIRADNALAHLAADDNTITSMDLLGHATVTSAPGRTDGPPELHAGTMLLEFREDGRTLRHVTLAGPGSLMIVRAADGTRTITAADIDARIGPDGGKLTGISTKSAVRVEIVPGPGAARDTPTRIISAASLQSEGSDAAGLQFTDFNGDANLEEKLAKSKTNAGFDRQTKAGSMRMHLNGDLGAVSSVHFNGGFHFVNGDQDANASEAGYDEESGLLRLLPASGPHGQPANVQISGRIFVSAASIQLDTRTTNMIASSGANGVMSATLEPQAAQPGQKKTAPALFDDKQQIIAVCHDLQYVDANGGTVTLSGDARLFQKESGDTVNGADTIELRSGDGSLDASHAGGRIHVQSRMTIGDSTNAAAVKASQSRCPVDATCVSAASLHFDGPTRIARYATGVELDDPNGEHIQGESIDLYLDPVAAVIQDARVRGNVQAWFYDADGTKWVDGSSAGELKYNVGEDQFNVTGKPVVVETKKGAVGHETCNVQEGGAVNLQRASSTHPGTDYQFTSESRSTTIASMASCAAFGKKK